MRQSTIIHSLILSLALVGIACARGNRGAALTAAAAATDTGEFQSSATTIQSFTAVEGADLMGRLEAARTRARGGQTPYWSAYAFDVRPGVAVDPNIHQFNGSMNNIGDTTVFILTSSPEERDRQRAAELGAKRYLVKPPTPQMLIEALNDCYQARLQEPATS